MRTRFIAAIAGASCVALSSCGGDDPSGPWYGSVVGQLTEVESGEPVPDARVVLLDPRTLRTASASTPADAMGRYRIDGVNAGEYALVVYHDELVIFDWPSPLLEVGPQRETQRDLRLQRSGLWNGSGPRVSGTILDASTGQPIAAAYAGSSVHAGVDIEAPFFGTTLPEMAVTDALGRFTLKYCCLFCWSGNYCIPPISVTKSGYEPFTLVGRGPEIFPGYGSMLPMPDSVLHVEIRLRPEVPDAPRGAVRGQLAFAGRPVSGVHVALSLAVVAQPDTFPPAAGKAWNNDVIAAPLPDRVAISDANGDFLIPRVPFGTYEVIAAYLADDGYIEGWMRRVSHRFVAITDTANVDVGTLELGKALRTLHPIDGSFITERSPEIQWEPLTDLPAGYHLVDYSLAIDDDYALDVVLQNLVEPRWQVPVYIRPNAHMRWIASARVVYSGSPDTLILGRSERAATFTVVSNVTITVSSGTSPTFSWAPADPVASLWVENEHGTQWAVRSDSTNTIESPIHYGTVPMGAHELTPPTSLVPGMTYRVVLGVFSGASSEGILAYRNFTP